MWTANVRGSTSMVGRASFIAISALATPRMFFTGAIRRRTASQSLSPSSSATGATNASDKKGATDGDAPNIGRARIGCVVGIEAFASPICAHAMSPPFRTTAGRMPKNAGFQRQRSASLPTSTEPTSSSNPWAIAGLIVTLAA